MPELDQLPRHARLLVSLSQRPEVRGGIADAKSVLETASGRERFTRLARELGIEGLAISALTGSVVRQSLSPEVVTELETRWRQLQQRALVWDIERERVLHALDRSGVTAILLKGSALRELVFHEPAHRAMGDLDLLLTSEALDNAVNALRESGYATDPPEVMEAYRRHHFHYRLTHPRGFIVELHWALSEPGATTPLDAVSFIERSVAVQRSGGTSVRVPSPEDLLLHVVAQNAYDSLGSLRRIIDIDRIVARWPALDWDYVLRAARRARLDVVFAASLRLAERTMRTAVPATIARNLDVPAAARFHLALLEPVPWIVSPPARRRAAAAEAIRIWTTLDARHRLRGLASIARGENSLADGIDGSDTRRSGRRGQAAGALRLAKFGLYHIAIYARSGIAATTRAGRERLRFWR